MKKLTHWIVAMVLTGSVLAFNARAADSPSVLLQKEIYAEETEGNVDAAIKIYEQIAAEAATSRAVVAQAQYRLAVCGGGRGLCDRRRVRRDARLAGPTTKKRGSGRP